MRWLTLTQFVTLDGVVQSPGAPQEDPSGGFTKGGWLPPFFDPAVGEVMDARFAKADGFVLGRKTFDIFAGHWPNVDDEEIVAAKLNHLPKYVASNTTSSSDWADTHFLSGDLQIHGSATLARTLMAAGLIDVFELLVFPVVLGQGRRLFSDGLERSLRLVGAATTATGVNIVTYEQGDPITFDAVADPRPIDGEAPSDSGAEKPTQPTE